MTSPIVSMCWSRSTCGSSRMRPAVFNPVDPVGLPPVWLLVRGDEAPRPGMPCLTLAVTALDGADEEGEVHAAVETGWPKKLPEGALNGARFALWVLRDLLDGGSQEC